MQAQQSGSYSVPLQIYSLPRAGSTSPPKLRASTSFAVEVGDAQALLPQAQAAVEALQPTAAADKTPRAKALEAVMQARALHAQAQYDKAVAQWLAAADWLARIGSVDTSAAQQATALALEATTDALCIQRCGSPGCQ